MPLRVLLLVSCLWLACATPAPRPLSTASTAASAEPELVLVESSPVETSLDHADIPDAWRVWPEMIGAATRTLEIEQFYVSNAPNSRLEPVIQAIEAAADRGVRVRLLAEEKFFKQYPETQERLAARRIEVRRLDTAQSLGGVQHAKYFIVDGREAFLGSQNFDWRALEHIQELGLRVRVPEVVRALGAVFEYDWALAAGSPPAAPSPGPAGTVGPGPFPARFDGETVQVTPAFSPRGHLPEPAMWDLPRLVELIDGAKRSVRVQLLNHRAKSRDGSEFRELEDALKRAAARGVRVELMVADWSKRPGTIEGLQALHAPPGLTVKLVTIPRWSGGFIPFARVVHAKYLVVDGEASWLGTSNWEADYFFRTRNVGLIVEGAAFARQLERFFSDTWSSPYAAEVDPRATYTPPAISSEP
ncbi:phospholipase D-like domain-containing protein [Hyalangium sp.]|uniref:phospholipase D-like domain-containing protein n=1 Tax=Hyalangium sp. TaxID=2028555 RepID=UPI002D4A0542|nr:phospholipase D-like domain-containing protein [Hyalangium sp.]HYI02388.1 phospholipase D-like domain-containing protein [Hyalangium sp.]